jgi:hypothetical protein
MILRLSSFSVCLSLSGLTETFVLPTKNKRAANWPPFCFKWR